MSFVPTVGFSSIGEIDDSCRSCYVAGRTVFDYQAESRRRNLLRALGVPALTGGTCGLPRGHCPCTPRFPQSLARDVCWGKCQRNRSSFTSSREVFDWRNTLPPTLGAKT